MSDVGENYPDYWWFESGRHLFKGLRKPRHTGEWNLDPVFVAGCMKVEELVTLMLETGSDHGMPRTFWMTEVLRVMQARNLEEFCGGMVDEPKLTPLELERIGNMQVPQERLDMLKKMKDWKLLEKLPEGMRVTAAAHFYVGLFAVPKSSGMWRIIFDCRFVNAWLKSPYAFELPSLKEVFETVAAFRYFAVFDLRQFFYMLPLPEAVRNLFLLICGEEVYRAAVWCMGYHTSPWTAASISSMCAILAVYRAGLKIKDLDMKRTAPPRTLDIISKDGEVQGRILWWIDNCMIATTNDRTRESLLLGMIGPGPDKKHQGVLVRTRLVVKESWMDPETAEEPSATNRFKGIQMSENAVQFLNINFRKDAKANHILWRHMDLTRWDDIRIVPGQATHARWCHLVGVLMWHWQLGGDDKGSIRGVVELSRLLGHMDESDMVVRVDAKAQQELQTVVDAMFNTEEHLRVLAELPKRVVFGASDASAKAGAGVGWSHQGVARIVHGPQPWPADLKLKDINVRETWASTNTLKEILAGGVGKKLILMGTDNVTAKAAVRHGFYPGEEELTKALQDVKAEARRQEAQIMICHVPGKIMAADAPSRNEALDQDLCDQTLKVLKEYWMSLVNADRQRRMNIKRPRE